MSKFEFDGRDELEETSNILRLSFFLGKEICHLLFNSPSVIHKSGCLRGECRKLGKRRYHRLSNAD